MPIEPRPEILNAPAAHHGAFDYAELERLGFSPDEVIDFSVNSNPYGPPPGVREAIANVPLDRYPDRECIALRRKLAQHIYETYHGKNIEIENIVVGNGTSELLQLIAMAFIRANDNVLIIEPTFSEYERVSGLMGANIIRYFAPPENDFLVDQREFERILAENPIRVVFFGSPNNPTGFSLFNRAVRDIANRNPDTLFVSDEAYINFKVSLQMAATMLGVGLQPNVLAVRSMTKDFALAGLRLGYVVGTKELISTIAFLRPAWNVNALAQDAGLIALDHYDYIREQMLELWGLRLGLAKEIEQIGFKTTDSDVNFFLVKVENATEFRSKLLQHKIMVRDCTSFGLPEYVRIATRTPEDNAKLVAAVKAIL